MLNPIPILWIVGGVMGLVGMLIGYLSLVKVEKIVELPAGIVLVGGFFLVSLTGFIRQRAKG
jgi:hypothetical protein